MFSVSKHYIISSMMSRTFGQVGSIALKFLIGDAAVGYYTASLSCASMTSFVFIAVIDSARPIILESKRKSCQLFENNMIRLYSVIFYISLVQCVVITLFSGLIVHLLYGEAYSISVPALRLIVWYTLFSYMGTVRDIWILAEGKQFYLWIVNLLGLICNIVINLIFIPLIGIAGAALAAVGTQLFTNFVLGYIIKPFRENNRLIVQGLNPKYILDILTMIRKQ